LSAAGIDRSFPHHALDARSEAAGVGIYSRFPIIASDRIGIDHILTRNATAVTTTTFKIPDTDHRALLATVMVPQN
jgi:endonuclease/exonuclease/phosphatase (EEP) superfamily protein YafD